MTNFTPKGAKRGPLARVLRQLRLSWDELALRPQFGSRIAFPSAQLDFTNDFLNSHPIEHLKHIFVALCLQCQRMPDVASEVATPQAA